MAPTPEQTTEVLAQALRALGEHAEDAGQPATGSPEFQRYFHGIAEAHHVIRKVFRLVDEQARRAGLDPLEHKLLIQVLGAPDAPLHVNEAAARLDVAPALASRLIKRLQGRELVQRAPDPVDRRITRVTVTDAGRELLAHIDRAVRRQVQRLQDELSDEERAAALRIFAFYLGAEPS